MVPTRMVTLNDVQTTAVGVDHNRFRARKNGLGGAGFVEVARERTAHEWTQMFTKFGGIYAATSTPLPTTSERPRSGERSR